MYYQLQEILKQQIESGFWKPGDALPSEPELARRFEVSRVVVRQALAILQDDHQIVRIRGRGTFVARPKIDYRASGLSRSLATRRGDEVTIHVLDKRTGPVERSISESLEAPPDASVLRLISMLSVERVPLAITYSFFLPEEVPWLDDVAHVGRNLPASLALADHGVELAHSRLSIEASQCGQFEADRFGVSPRSPVFLIRCAEHRRTADGTAPFELARIVYRGDLLQFHLHTAENENDMAATFELNSPIETLTPSI